MIPSLQKFDAVSTHRINEPMFFGYSARPCSREDVFKRLRLADSAERISHDGLNQIDHPQSQPPICFDPESQVLPEFGMKDCARRLICQVRTRGAASRPIEA